MCTEWSAHLSSTLWCIFQWRMKQTGERKKVMRLELGVYGIGLKKEWLRFIFIILLFPLCTFNQDLDFHLSKVVKHLAMHHLLPVQLLYIDSFPSTCLLVVCKPDSSWKFGRTAFIWTLLLIYIRAISLVFPKGNCIIMFVDLCPLHFYPGNSEKASLQKEHSTVHPVITFIRVFML